MQCALCMPTLYDASKRVAVDEHIPLLQKLDSIVGTLRIPALQLIGLPWLNKVVLSCLAYKNQRLL